MSDDVITEFLRKRTIMSDFRLIEHVANSKSSYEELPGIQGSIQLSKEELASILESWNGLIDKFGKFLEKSARSLLAKAEGSVLYQFDEKNKLLQQAALICEIFRYPGISKNSSQLDIRKLQKNIYELLKHESDAFELVIGWGQAKQTCGQLKTSGPLADLAEVFAIMQLSVILRAIQLIIGSKKKVRLKVLTGASRFATAFYPTIAINEKYDGQRQIISDYFNGKGNMLFEPYRKMKHNLSPNEQKRMEEFKGNCALVKDSHIVRIYNHILLSINWHDLLTTDLPIDIPDLKLNQLLTPIRKWIKEQPDFEFILRKILVSMLQHKKPTDSNYEQLHYVVDTITRDSAVKYIALQYTDAGFDLNDYELEGENKFIRLTVHEKKDRPDIPAIFTLGKVGGNYLSQNVTVLIDKKGEARFKSLVEILDEYKVKAVYAPHAEQLPLGWLFEQPICYVDEGCENISEKLKTAFNAWLEGIIEI